MLALTINTYLSILFVLMLYYLSILLGNYLPIIMKLFYQYVIYFHKFSKNINVKFNLKIILLSKLLRPL